MPKYNAKQLRKLKASAVELKKIKRNPIYLVLDRIIDTYNTGSLFRLADAVAAEKMYLCGEMDYPPSSRIHKAAVGTENWVPWVKYKSGHDAVKDLKSLGVQIIAVEQNARSIPYSLLRSSKLRLLPGALKFPCAVVVGNETGGITEDILDEADIVVELPMYGINKSFNVWGSAAVVAYKILEGLK